MESHKIEQHGSRLCTIIYDAKLSKPKIKAIKPISKCMRDLENNKP